MVFIPRYRQLFNCGLVFLCLFIVSSLYLLSQPHVESQSPSIIKKENRIDKVDASSETDALYNDKIYEEKSSSRCESESNVKQLKCVINDAQPVSGCLAYKGHPYVLFSLVENNFEVIGEVVEDTLQWSQSKAYLKNIHLPYSHQGVYLFFSEYNVAKRDRVLFVSPEEGVPVSNQWDKRGYYYPIQIAQFGLSHYSKYIINKRQKSGGIIDFIDNSIKWNVPMGALMKLTGDSHLQFSSSPANEAISLSLNLKLAEDDSASDDVSRVMKVQGKWSYGTSLSLVCSWGELESVRIDYVCAKSHYGNYMKHWIHANKDHSVITYYLNQCSETSNGDVEINLTRDIQVDLIKSYSNKNKKSRNEVKSWTLLSIKSISLKGKGSLRAWQLLADAHIDHFLLAANWFLKHQDNQGGWSIPVPRVFKGFHALNPGWYSAMAQGHAISILVRAYNFTGRKSYLSAAERSLALFKRSSKNGGITAHFLSNQSLPWYEEYPTQPPLFVLNGFIYSLIGLYDLSRVTSSPSSQQAHQLYSSGLSSLYHLLPLFDSGFGSFYDLRHFTGAIKGFDGPNRARWDYHTVHIEQLHLLAHLNPHQPIWTTTAKRWTSYLSGHRSPHN